MALTLRLVKGDTLTFEELDGNFILLSQSKADTDFGNVLPGSVFSSSQGVINVGGVFTVDMGLSTVNSPTFAGLNVSGPITTPSDVLTILDGQTSTIETIDANGSEAAFFDYVIKTADGNHKRAGGAIVTWKVSTGLVEFTDYSTVDIGDTSAIYIGATIATTTVNVRVTNNSGQSVIVSSKTRLV